MKWQHLVTFAIIIICLIFSVIFRKNWVHKVTQSVVKKLNFSFGIFLIVVYTSTFVGYGIIGWYWHLTFGDLCSFIGFFSIPFFLTNKKRIIKMLSPWFFIGGFMALATTFAKYQPGSRINDFNVELSYVKHTFYLIFSIYFLMFMGEWDKKDYRNTVFFIIFFVIWIIIVCGIPYWVTGNNKWAVFSTGLLEPSYRKIRILGPDGTVEITGEYIILRKIAIYPIPTIIYYILCINLAWLYGVSCGYVNKWMNGEKASPKWILFIKKYCKNNRKK